MKIGNVDIEGKSVLAPLAGITDLPFRLICRELGASLVYTEMISAEGLIRNQPNTLAVTDTDPAEDPVVFQLFGKRPASLAEAARVLSAMGVKIIDINMGCPVRKVAGHGSGAALLKDVTAAEALMKAVVDAAGVPVTVKIRTGWNAAGFVAAELARAAEAVGVAAVAVHGRHAKQGFSGTADWSAIRAVKEAVGIPVIGNGDVKSAADARKMVEETGCDAVMIGRGALGNPWIFREVEEGLRGGAVPESPGICERGEMLVRHLRAVVARSGELSGVKMMRKHGAWYSRGITGCAEFRRSINAAETASAYEQAAADFFGVGAGAAMEAGGR